ncbi:MAG: response regulator [Rhodocyclaceae bacterium]
MGDEQDGLAVLSIDDHPIVMDALATAFVSTRIFARVDKARTLRGGLDLLADDAGYALIVIDLHMPDSDGLEAVEQLRLSYPDIPLMVFSGESGSDIIIKAFELGVRGYVVKDSALDVVLWAVRLILAGSAYVPPQAMNLPDATAIAPEPAVGNLSLSPRQRQVLALLLQGMPNKVIARRLGMAEGTVKTHLNTLYRVIGAHNRAQAILRAHDLGLI